MEILNDLFTVYLHNIFTVFHEETLVSLLCRMLYMHARCNFLFCIFSCFWGKSITQHYAYGVHVNTFVYSYNLSD